MEREVGKVMENFHLESYLSNGVENIVKGIMKASLKNPMTSIYMLQYVKESKKARKLREHSEEKGEHIPPFLIASITNKCNLHCKGCYARANHSCVDHETKGMPELLTAEKWKDIFEQAANLGVGFILLAGGEPFVRKDVLMAAGEEKRLLFPIFTNGTMIDKDYLELLSKKRNLIPILSIEGNQKTTDDRRGEGIYLKLQEIMKLLHNRGILFGASVTVNKNNRKEVLSAEFIQNLTVSGCKALIYVEYVPMDQESRELALDDLDREEMTLKLNELRMSNQEMLFIAFPGDEKSSGGCLAAGRGFFHINSYGGAEPCPFSPYSDTSLTDTSLKEALNSPLFMKLQNDGNLLQEHIGGCVLFEQADQVKKMLTEFI